MNKNVKIAKELVKLAKEIISSEKIFSVRNTLTEYELAIFGEDSEETMYEAMEKAGILSEVKKYLNQAMILLHDENDVDKMRKILVNEFGYEEE